MSILDDLKELQITDPGTRFPFLIFIPILICFGISGVILYFFRKNNLWSDEIEREWYRQLPVLYGFSTFILFLAVGLISKEVSISNLGDSLKGMALSAIILIILFALLRQIQRLIFFLFLLIPNSEEVFLINYYVKSIYENRVQGILLILFVDFVSISITAFLGYFIISLLARRKEPSS